MSTYRPNNDQIEFSLPKQGYAAFDAASLKTLIIDRLNSNEVFTDQNYEGSNMNAFIDVVSYAYHVLLFYLNNTSNESLFSESQIYENINRIVKSLHYKPVGYQAPTLSITGNASSQLPVGTYTIPRYSYIDIGGYRYSFNSDTTFVKSTTGEEEIPQFTGNTLLYQGNYIEYPEYTASGDPNEVLVLVPGEGVNIDHFNIDVYVQEGGEGGSYYQYDTSTSLLFSRPTTRSAEIRLNENKRYEIKFGNGVNGRQLTSQDIVYVYYLSTNGTAGEVSENDAVNKKVTVYSSTQLTSLKESTNIKGDGVVYADQSETDYVLISNSEPSTKYYTGETVEDIRENAPQTFSSQYRLVSISDYENYVKSNFSNFISDVKVVDNTKYMDTHIKYYYDLGLKSPSLESRILMNQVHFSTSCNFNNLYLYCVPRLEKTTSLAKRSNYLTTSQKELITNRLSNTKTITCDPIVMDPVYVTVDIGARGTNETISPDVPVATRLMVVQEDTSRANSNDIIQKVSTIIKTYFAGDNASIGMTLDLTSISNDILSIQGVTTFYTYRPDLDSTYVEGLSLMVWNPVYPTDILQTSQNYTLPIFKFPFFKDVDEFAPRVDVLRASDANTILSSGGNNQVNVSSSDIVTETGNSY